MQLEGFHPILRRLLEEAPGGLPVETDSFRSFVARVDEVIRDADADRRLAQQSLEFSTEELLRAHQEMRAVLRSQPDIICHLDSTGTIRSCSTSSYRDLIHPPQTLIGRRIDSIPDRDIGRRFRVAWKEALRTGRLQSIDYELAPKGARTSFFEARLVPMGTDDCVVVIRNVDERKQLEAQLIQAQKLESMAHLAAGIAHEINTPTQYVTDNTRFLEDSFAELDGLFSAVLNLEDILTEPVADRAGIGSRLHPEGREDGPDTPSDPATSALQVLKREADRVSLGYLREEVPKAIEQSLEGLTRIARIVAAMREFSHPGSNEMMPTDLNRALENTLTVSKNEWKYVADLELDLDPDLPAVRCLPAELNQVFLNIIVNAAQTISDAVRSGLRKRGVLGVSTRQDGDVVEIRLSDTGTGIPERIQDRVFDPFFTTKGVGKGTGQGLAISHSVVVDKHHGSIEFSTEQNQGTTFIIRIPIEGYATAAAA